MKFDLFSLSSYPNDFDLESDIKNEYKLYFDKFTKMVTDFMIQDQNADIAIGWTEDCTDGIKNYKLSTELHEKINNLAKINGFEMLKSKMVLTNPKDTTKIQFLNELISYHKENIELLDKKINKLINPSLPQNPENLQNPVNSNNICANKLDLDIII